MQACIAQNLRAEHISIHDCTFQKTAHSTYNIMSLHAFLEEIQFAEEVEIGREEEASRRSVYIPQPAPKHMIAFVHQFLNTCLVVLFISQPAIRICILRARVSGALDIDSSCEFLELREHVFVDPLFLEPQTAIPAIISKRDNKKKRKESEPIGGSYSHSTSCRWLPQRAHSGTPMSCCCCIFPPARNAYVFPLIFLEPQT
jgi:hypothetical protein